MENAQTLATVPRKTSHHFVFPLRVTQPAMEAMTLLRSDNVSEDYIWRAISYRMATLIERNFAIPASYDMGYWARVRAPQCELIAAEALHGLDLSRFILQNIGDLEYVLHVQAFGWKLRIRADKFKFKF